MEERPLARVRFLDLHISAKLTDVVALLALASLVLAADCSGLKRRLYEPADRDSWQHPEHVIQSLSINAGERIADLGAGGGYFTFRLAKAVGSTGRVYALDVDPDMTGLLERSDPARDGAGRLSFAAQLRLPTEAELPGLRTRRPVRATTAPCAAGAGAMAR